MTAKEFYEITNGNYQNALNTMMNDDFIKRMLSKFAQNNAVGELLEAYDNKDFQKVFVAAHSIKGVAGNLALTGLYDKVIPIVEGTRNAEASSSINIDSEINDFRKEYNHLMSQLEIFLRSQFQ